MSQKLLINKTQIDFARRLPLFDGLTEDEKDMILKDAGVYAYTRKNALFMQGDNVHSFSVVCNGTVQLLRATPEGREVTTGIRIAGQTLGEKEIFAANTRHHVSAIAVDKVEMLEVPVEILKRNPHIYTLFSRNVLTSISQAALWAEVEAEHQATMTAAQLVSCYLQHICVQHDADPDQFTLPYKKSLIASRLGMELETFSRTLPKLKKHGINVAGPNVSFHDLDAISKHTCDHCSMSELCGTYKSLRKVATQAATYEHRGVQNDTFQKTA